MAAPVVVGFLRLSTQKRAFHAPLDLARAAGLVRSWFRQPPVRELVAGSGHWERVLALLEACGAACNLTSDAQLAAIALEYGGEVHTADADFARFPGVRWRNPLA